MDLVNTLHGLQKVLVLLFWMLAFVQVLMSYLIRWHALARQISDGTPVSNSQRKDDIVAGVIMGVVLLGLATGMADVIYLAAIAPMIWLSLRAKTRLDLLKP